MTAKMYFGYLLGLVAILAIILLGFHSINGFGQHQSFSMIVVSFFFVQSTLVYIVGERLARSSNKQDYSSLIIGNNLFKMVLSIALVLAYVKLTEPTDRYFIVIFLIVYIAFTIFEAYFMTIQAKYKGS